MRKLQEFTGKVAVITGAASGIGEALVLHSASQGMSVVLADINQKQLNALSKRLDDLGAPYLALATDVSDPEAVEKLAAASFERFGRVDMLFNNAGVLFTGYSWERSLEDWKWLLGINLMGVVHGIRSFVPRMLEQGGESHIINTSSVGGLVAMPQLGPYTASKMAVRGITETLYQEMQEVNPQLSVSLLCPGPIDTAMAATARQGTGDTTGDIPEPSGDYMPAQQCAEIVFEAIRCNKFWIFTHPELKRACLQQLKSMLDDGHDENHGAGDNR